MFTTDEREQIRTALVSVARQDPNIAAAAHLGSAAAGRLDEWSDIDLALCVSPGAELEEAVGEWTSRLYHSYGAVAHCDVRRGQTLYRVFLLHSTLQVDISFWSAGEFRALGPHFELIFGVQNEPQPTPAVSADELMGFAWLYALHVRCSVARNRLLQAEYMLSNMRSQVLALACLRHGLPTRDGRGFDDLPDGKSRAFEDCYPTSIQAEELHRALRSTMAMLLTEIRRRDHDLAVQIESVLLEIAGLDV